jgi:hypothetical protein
VPLIMPTTSYKALVRTTVVERAMAMLRMEERDFMAAVTAEPA